MVGLTIALISVNYDNNRNHVYNGEFSIMIKSEFNTIHLACVPIQNELYFIYVPYRELVY
jgi:hypothetical protein